MRVTKLELDRVISDYHAFAHLGLQITARQFGLAVINMCKNKLVISLKQVVRLLGDTPCDALFAVEFIGTLFRHQQTVYVTYIRPWLLRHPGYEEITMAAEEIALRKVVHHSGEDTMNAW